MLPGLGPLFLWGRGATCAAEVVLAMAPWAVPFWAEPAAAAAAAAAAASAAAFSMAMVSLLGRRPRTPFLTGRGGRGVLSL